MIIRSYHIIAASSHRAQYVIACMSRRPRATFPLPALALLPVLLLLLMTTSNGRPSELKTLNGELVGDAEIHEVRRSLGQILYACMCVCILLYCR